MPPRISLIHFIFFFTVWGLGLAAGNIAVMFLPRFFPAGVTASSYFFSSLAGSLFFAAALAFSGKEKNVSEVFAVEKSGVAELFYTPLTVTFFYTVIMLLLNPSLPEFFKPESAFEMVLMLLSGVILAPFTEEILFRFFMHESLLEISGSPSISIFITSILFALIHPYDPLLRSVVFLLSLTLGFLRQKKGLACSISTHLMINLTGLFYNSLFR